MPSLLREMFGLSVPKRSLKRKQDSTVETTEQESTDLPKPPLPSLDATTRFDTTPKSTHQSLSESPLQQTPSKGDSNTHPWQNDIKQSTLNPLAAPFNPQSHIGWLILTPERKYSTASPDIDTRPCHLTDDNVQSSPSTVTEPMTMRLPIYVPPRSASSLSTVSTPSTIRNGRSESALPCHTCMDDSVYAMKQEMIQCATCQRRVHKDCGQDLCAEEIEMRRSRKLPWHSGQPDWICRYCVAKRRKPYSIRRARQSVVDRINSLVAGPPNEHREVAYPMVESHPDASEVVEQHPDEAQSDDQHSLKERPSMNPFSEQSMIEHQATVHEQNTDMAGDDMNRGVQLVLASDCGHDPPPAKRQKVDHARKACKPSSESSEQRSGYVQGSVIRSQRADDDSEKLQESAHQLKKYIAGESLSENVEASAEQGEHVGVVTHPSTDPRSSTLRQSGSELAKLQESKLPQTISQQTVPEQSEQQQVQHIQPEVRLLPGVATQPGSLRALNDNILTISKQQHSIPPAQLTYRLQSGSRFDNCTKCQGTVMVIANSSKPICSTCIVRAQSVRHLAGSTNGKVTKPSSPRPVYDRYQFLCARSIFLSTADQQLLLGSLAVQSLQSATSTRSSNHTPLIKPPNNTNVQRLNLVQSTAPQVIKLSQRRTRKQHFGQPHSRSRIRGPTTVPLTVLRQAELPKISQSSKPSPYTLYTQQSAYETDHAQQTGQPQYYDNFDDFFQAPRDLTLTLVNSGNELAWRDAPSKGQRSRVKWSYTIGRMS